MKKIACLVLVLLLVSGIAATAENAVNFDLSGLSFAELVQLRKEIDLLIFGSEEYKEVSVPAGDYIIGEDIPAGVYSLESSGIAMFEVYADKNMDFMGLVAMHSVGNGETVGRIELKEGQIVSITLSSIIFKTYTGLGF